MLGNFKGLTQKCFVNRVCGKEGLLSDDFNLPHLEKATNVGMCTRTLRPNIHFILNGINLSNKSCVPRTKC